jgi:hypothetical protein
LGSGANLIDLFFFIIDDRQNKLDRLLLGKRIQLSLIFVGKVRAYSSKALNLSHTCKRLKKQKMILRKNTLAYFFLCVNDEVKKFYEIDFRDQCYNTFYVRNLRIFVIS